MKKITKILSVLIAFCMVLSTGSAVAYAREDEKSIYTGTLYAQNSRFDNYVITNGIDVSEHNGDINWAAVKAAGTDYAFIRVGYTGYGESGTKVYDKNYKQNIEGALAAGIKVGVYWYSQAINRTEAAAEAEKIISAIGNYNITMPVVFDYEFGGTGNSGRLYARRNSLGKATMTAIANKFCERVEQAGYTACVYASENFFKDYLIPATLAAKYEIWLANYASKTNYSGEYNYWQYSSKGKVNGISGYVDANFRYTPVYEANDINSFNISDITPVTYSQGAVTPLITVEKNGVTLTKDIDYTLTYTKNTAPGVGRVTVTGINAYKGQAVKSFRIAPAQTAAPSKVSTENGLTEISWPASYGASGYWVRYVNVKTGAAGGLTVYTNDAAVDGLDGLTDYNFSVIPFVNINGLKIFGAYSAESLIKTGASKLSNFKQSGASASSVTLSWDAQNGASGYKIYRYNSKTKKKSLVKTITGANQTSVTVSNLNAGSYYYYIAESFFTDEKGAVLKSPQTSKLKVSTKSKTPSIKKPKNTAKRKIKVSWKKVKATGYQIQFSTSKTFKSNTKSVWVKKGSITSKTIKTARSKKTYYIRVRAYRTPDGKKVFSSWSKTMKIKSR